MKRVSLDFDWPMKQTWAGYVNPYPSAEKCQQCDGTGYSPNARLYQAQWYGNAPFDPTIYGSDPVLTIDSVPLRESVESKIRWADELVRRGHDRENYYTRGGRIPFSQAVDMEVGRMFGFWQHSWSHQLNQADVNALVAADRLWDFTRVAINDEQREVVRQKRASGENSWLPYANGHKPTAPEVNAWSMEGMGHDGINCFVCVRARCEREGVPYLCDQCDGTGENWPSKVQKQLYESWKPVEPFEGGGWQMWETTSEGSPISPVFATPEELARWLADTVASAFGKETATYDQWLKMIVGSGSSPSAVIGGDGVLKSGVADERDGES